MRLALVSLNQVWKDKDANFLNCEVFVQQASQHGCSLVIFPEMTLTGYSLDIATVAEPEIGSITLKRFGEMAEKFDIAIIFGACLIDSKTTYPRNQLCLALNTGLSKAIYSKIHPFSYAGESMVLEAGTGFIIAEVGELKFGASICYDLRFPELYASMAKQSNATIVIANWPASRLSHWKALIVARAIENQLFVLGINRTGIDGNGLLYEKSSFIARPDGTLLEAIRVDDEIDIYDINLDETTQYRNIFPTLQDKRYSLYREFLDSMNVN